MVSDSIINHLQQFCKHYQELFSFDNNSYLSWQNDVQHKKSLTEKRKHDKIKLVNSQKTKGVFSWKNGHFYKNYVPSLRFPPCCWEQVLPSLRRYLPPQSQTLGTMTGCTSMTMRKSLTETGIRSGWRAATGSAIMLAVRYLMACGRKIYAWYVDANRRPRL